MHIHLNASDYVILVLYFVLILAIGLRLRRRMLSSSEYFQAGRSLPAWITGIAFVAANSGALEIMGVVSTSAKYGARANQFYWSGAIPAMIFLGLFMMPIYYCSRVRSVPEFLKLRFNEATSSLNAVSFAILMLLTSGVSLYAMAITMQSFLGWGFWTSAFGAAMFVSLYIMLGGLTATIYNEVLQFGLIILGLTPLLYFTLRDFGGIRGLQAKLPQHLAHTWAGLPLVSPSSGPMDAVGSIFGLAFVLSAGYWCTDFLLVQRALAAKDERAAIQTPLIGSVAKLAFPALVVIPGLAAVLLVPANLAQRYDLALPNLMAHYYGHGLLGLGVLAMMASFMSGMAGNITAFNTVWTYDIYQSYIARGRTDAHYLQIGRLTTVVATLLSLATAYIVLRFNSMMDYIQLLFSFFNAPLFATFLLGMFTRWVTPWAAFFGLILGMLSALSHHLLVSRGVLHYGSDMSANFYGAIVAWSVCFLVTILLSFITIGKDMAELEGLVYGGSALRGLRRNKSSWLLAAAVALVCLFLNWFFW